MSSFSIRRDDKPYILFNKDLKIVIVELSKLNKPGADLFDFKEFWCYFIKEADRLTREDRKRLSKHKEMEEAMDHFDKLSQEESLRNIALDRHMADVIHGLNRQAFKEEIQKGRKKGREEGREEGRKKGREEGRKEKLQELIWNMLQEGIKISVISKVTGLSEDEVLKLKK